MDSADIDEARRLEFVDAEEVVESWRYSTTSHVCSVASGANDTRRFASDFLRASRRALSSFNWSPASFSSRSRTAACCSSSVRNMTLVSTTAGLTSIELEGGTVDKDSLLGFDLGVSFVSARFAFRAGISCSRGIVGFSMDFGGGAAIDYFMLLL